jgi:hypothetical protein
MWKLTVGPINLVALLLPHLPFSGNRSNEVNSLDTKIESLDDLEDIVTANNQFRYYTSRGVGDERQVVNQDLFDLIKSVAFKYARELDYGGNASTMAARAFLEGCRIKTGFPLNEEYFNKYFDGNTERVEVIGGLREINDYHLSLNYYMTDKIWNIDVPRSNRLFLNHDRDNDKMVALEKFLENISDLDIIVIGGTQLPSTYETFVPGLTHLVEVLSLPENKEKQVHLESAAFSNQTFYETQLDILLQRVDCAEPGHFIRHERARVRGLLQISCSQGSGRSSRTMKRSILSTKPDKTRSR